MDDFVRRIYLTELLRLCRYSLSAIGEVNRLLSASDLPTNVKVEGVLRALDDFLGDAARIRLLLWPTRRAAEPRGEALRSALDIEETNPLMDATLRHHLEHFDERLDAWVDGSPNRIFVDHLLGPRNSIGGVRPSDIIRHFVPEEAVYIFRGEEFNIQRLATAVDELAVKVQAALDEDNFWQPRGNGR